LSKGGSKSGGAMLLCSLSICQMAETVSSWVPFLSSEGWRILICIFEREADFQLIPLLSSRYRRSHGGKWEDTALSQGKRSFTTRGADAILCGCHSSNCIRSLDEFVLEAGMTDDYGIRYPGDGVCVGFFI
jgi:hypothetical protein